MLCFFFNRGIEIDQEVRFGLRLFWKIIILENPILEGTARKLLLIGMLDHKNNNPVDLASVK